MTQRIYETDGHCRQFDAVVTACVPAQSGYRISLTRTAFFPEGGGQYADTGTLSGVSVRDVQLENDEIWHVADRPLTVGDTVTGVLDWDIRFVRMQHHTGEHIVSGMIHRLYGYHNVGFHLGHGEVTLDIDGELTRAQLRDVERRANAAVAANRPVIVDFPDADTLATLDFRSKKELDGAVRIVTIPDTDVCACCAPHVAYTGEIGGIKLTQMYRYKGGVRIHLLCGDAAMAAHETLYTAASAAAARLSVKPHELDDAVAHLLAQKEALMRDLAAARRALASEQARALPAHQPLCAVFLADADADTLRILVDRGMGNGNRITAVCAGTDADGYIALIGTAGDVHVLSDTLKTALSARGGGRDGRWNGRIAAGETDIRAVLSALAQTV